MRRSVHFGRLRRRVKLLLVPRSSGYTDHLIWVENKYHKGIVWNAIPLTTNSMETTALEAETWIIIGVANHNYVWTLPLSEVFDSLRHQQRADALSLPVRVHCHGC